MRLKADEKKPRQLSMNIKDSIEVRYLKTGMGGDRAVNISVVT